MIAGYHKKESTLKSASTLDNYLFRTDEVLMYGTDSCLLLINNHSIWLSVLSVCEMGIH